MFPQGFPFEKLVTEIRVKILDIALTSQERIKPFMFLNNDEKRAREEDGLESKPNSFLPIFLVCRGVYTEAIAIAYGENTFHFKSIPTLEYFTLMCKEPAKWMKKVVLSPNEFNFNVGLAEMWALLQPRYIKLSTHHMSVHYAQQDLHDALKRLPRVSHLRIETNMIHVLIPQTAPMPFLVISELTRVMAIAANRCAIEKIWFDVFNVHYKGKETKFIGSLVFLSTKLRSSLVASLWASTYVLGLQCKMWDMRKVRRSKRLKGQPHFGTATSK